MFAAGGTSIEDLAEKYPEKIIKIPIDIFEGITDAQACSVELLLGFATCYPNITPYGRYLSLDSIDH